MAENRTNEDQQLGAARTVEVYHIEEAVRQAQLARARYSVRLPIRGRPEMVEVNPAGLSEAQIQEGAPVTADEPYDAGTDESL